MGLIGCSIVVMALLFGATEAREYEVGDSFGWNIPPNQNFYSDWASSKSFFVGDSLGKLFTRIHSFLASILFIIYELEFVSDSDTSMHANIDTLQSILRLRTIWSTMSNTNQT